MEQKTQENLHPPAEAASSQALFAGRYRPIRLLGEGAMGRVYEAEDVLVGDRVAVKRLRLEWMPDPEAVERCRREVHAARRIAHPNVCRVFDLVVEPGAEGPGEVLLIMELVRGETLASRLERQGRLSPEEALPIVRQLCAGLGAAHAAGVVHRDLKPANVLLEALPDGERVVLTDFGLARCLYGSAATLTAAGDLVGSPAYLAPEQVRGQPLGPATDVFALGVVLYELLTGALPFGGETGVETALARLHGPPPPPSHAVPGLDPRWDRAVLQCLAIDPAERLREPAGILAALHSPMEPEPTPSARLRTFSARAALMALLVFTAGGATGHHVHPGPGPSSLGRQTEPVTVPAAWADTAVRPAPARTGESAPVPLDAAGQRLCAGDIEGARALYQDALATARTEGDRVTVIRALTGLGIVRNRDHDLVQAERLEREALRLARQLGEATRVASLLNNLGVVVVGQGRLPEAEKLYREAASLYGGDGDSRRRAAALNNLGNLLRHQGYLAEAAAAYHEALALRRATEDRRGEAVSLLSLGRLATRQGVPGEARERLTEALRIFRYEGHPDGVAETLTALAQAALAAGDASGARQALDEAWALSREQEYPRREAEVVRLRAVAALERGAPAAAVRAAREGLVAFEALFDEEGRARAGVVLARALVASGEVAEARALLVRLRTWEWVRQDRGLRLSVAAAGALADAATGADPEAITNRLSAVAEEASRHGLGEIERRTRVELAHYAQSTDTGAIRVAALSVSP